VVEPERASAHAALARLAELGAQALANARAHAAALERAERDPLTGLANHGHVWAALEREAARAERHGGALSLVMFDVDRFKSWNDRRGHLEGDAALVRLARLVRERSRREDTAGRYGGDEFALVLPETTREGAVNVAEKIRAAAEQLTDSDAAGALSAGVATAPADGTSAAELVRAADARLYQAKAAGGNRVVSTGATRA
jgi:diguanylate cyclase (GGDEF)-like protein